MCVIHPSIYTHCRTTFCGNVFAADVVYAILHSQPRNYDLAHRVIDCVLQPTFNQIFFFPRLIIYSVRDVTNLTCQGKKKKIKYLRNSFIIRMVDDDDDDD